MSSAGTEGINGIVFDIDTFAVHDGSGIRMAVYLKGCPLKCRWCHSPESQRYAPELIFARERCVLCGFCEKVCPQHLHRVSDSEHIFDRRSCQVCGRCVEHCLSGALAIKGKAMSVNEVVRRACRMTPFFVHSGGGITLTGGEVTAQSDFAAAILKGCKAQGIHTVIETSGACSWHQLAKLVEHTDLVLYDLKLMDEEAHRRWTGASNRVILDNVQRLRDSNLQIRIPLIPRITDTDENLQDIFAFVRGLELRRVALLPYNPSSAAKYEWVGRTYEIEGEPQDEARLEAIVRMARDMGLCVEIV